MRDIITFYKNSTTDKLANQANKICLNNYGNKIFVRGLIEFSNYCNKDCLYCGIRKTNKKIVRYRLNEQEIIHIVKQGYERNLKTFVLQSGEDDYYTLDILCSIILKIKEVTKNEAAITLSCGIKTKSEYQKLKQAGADRYLLRFETSDAVLHSYLRNGISFKKRIKALESLKECEYEVGSGYMTGLPNETEETRINNALLCRKLKLDMVGIGPFIPHPDTPLKDYKLDNFDITKRSIALVRMLLPMANIPATTATGSVDELGREKILQAGANVLMLNITPEHLKQYYLLYPGKKCLDEHGLQSIPDLETKMRKINKQISFERGDALSKIVETDLKSVSMAPNKENLIAK